MIWTTENRGRFFDLDEEPSLAPGDLVLLGPKGRRISVEAGAASDREIPADEALAARVQRLREAAGLVGERLTEVAAHSRGGEELAEAIQDLSARTLADVRRRLARRRAPRRRGNPSGDGNGFAVELRHDGQLALAALPPGGVASGYSLRLDLPASDAESGQ